jgi:hypothetical protein
MGAWGYGSFDNDTALDFIPELINQKPLKKLINQKHLETWQYDEVRVAAEIIIHLHKINTLWVDQEIINGLVDKLNLIIGDKEWLNDWRDEQEAKAMIRQLKGFVKKLEELEGY